MATLTPSVVGPFRAIGLRYVGKNENNEIPQIWEQLFRRDGELPRTGLCAGFGVCRCLPGATDGSFEYIAAFSVAPDSPVPAGMVELEIPQCDYLTLPVASLAEVKQVWAQAPEALKSLPEWKAYCGPDGCQCATHPCFEYYPPEFEGEGSFSVCIPVYRPSGA